MTLTRRSFIAGTAGAGIAACGLPRIVLAQTQADLTLLSYDDAQWGPVWDDMLSGFAAEPRHGVRGVTRRIVPWSELDSSIRRLGDANAADLIIMDGPIIATYAALGVIRPVDDIFPPEEQERFVRASTQAAVWQDRFYGPALDESSQGLWYNRSILDRHGITPPTSLETAWTWDEAREVFREVQAKERERRGNDQFWAVLLGQQGQLGGGQYTGQMMARSNGEAGSPTFAAISEDGLKASGFIDTPEAMEAYSFIQSLYAGEGLAPMSGTTDFFINEQCAFWLAAVSRRTEFEPANPNLRVGDTVSVTAAPYFRTPIIHTGSLHYGVSAFTREPERALELLKTLAAPKNLIRTAVAVGDYPSRSDLIDDPAFKDLHEDPLNIFTQSMRAWGHSRPKTPGFSEYQTIIDRMLADIARGGNVETLTRAATAELDQRLVRFKRYVRP